MVFSNINVKINFKFLFSIGLVGALLLISGAYLGFTFIPKKIEEKIWELKILKENTQQWDIFMKIPFSLDFKVYLFNIQNPEEILMGAKPVVKEIGPYVYKISNANIEEMNLLYNLIPLPLVPLIVNLKAMTHMQEYKGHGYLSRWKNEVAWNYASDEISYYEYEKYEFDQEASGSLTDDDIVTVLNAPYNSFLFTAESLSPGLLSLINSNLQAVFGKNNGLFFKTKVKDFLFDGVKLCGDEAEKAGLAAKAICSQVRNKAKETKQMRIKGNDVYFANFRFKNNTHQGYFTVKSGRNNCSEIAKLDYFENKTSISAWLDEKSSCNRIGGITTVFPAKIDSSMVFESFSEDICRSVKMDYAEFEMVQDIKGYRFVALNSTFNNSVTFQDNECFCINKTMNLDGEFGCLFDGISDLTNCKGITSANNRKVHNKKMKEF